MKFVDPSERAPASVSQKRISIQRKTRRLKERPTTIPWDRVDQWEWYFKMREEGV